MVTLHSNKTLAKEPVNAVKCTKETHTGGLQVAVHLLVPSQLAWTLPGQEPWVGKDKLFKRWLAGLQEKQHVLPSSVTALVQPLSNLNSPGPPKKSRLFSP